MITFKACPNGTKRKAQTTQQMGERVTSPVQTALRRSAQYLALFTFLVLVATSTWAQVLYGSIVGNVTDPNGAAVPGAKIEMTNLATGGVSSTMTDDSGAYKINDLQVGTYKLTISGASFKKTIKEDVRIDANKT